MRRKDFGRFTWQWHIATVRGSAAPASVAFAKKRYSPRLRKGYEHAPWLSRRRLEDPARVNSLTRRLRGSIGMREETPMSDVAARSSHSLPLPTPLVLCLFGLLGLLLAGLIVLIVAPQYLTWALSFIV